MSFKDHKLYDGSEQDVPPQILDRNGEVALGLCKVCGKGEIELDEPCMPKFKREPRYIVLKLKDMLNYLSASQYNAVMAAGFEIERCRKAYGKAPFNAAVVEQDWPEFDVVWAMIEARMTGKSIVTDEMITAYLKANDDYWHEHDKLEPPPAEWCHGKVPEATRMSLEAAFAAMVKP